MIVHDLSADQIDHRLRSGALRIRTGPVVFRVQTRSVSLGESLRLLYAQHQVEPEESFADFHVRLERPRTLRRWVRPQVNFSFDTFVPFTALPAHQALPLLEWGFNWCISSHYHRYIVIHAAAVERNGRAMILPAPPGSGKSTLCAALVNRGWRLLSDELTLLDPESGLVSAIARPVSLKNTSIDVIGRFAPNARFSALVHDTAKGSVAHMVPPVDSVKRATERAVPAWIVLPRFRAGAPTQLTGLQRGRALLHLAENAFNYTMHGRTGFNALCTAVSRCDCYEFSYSDLEEATELFANLTCPSTACRMT